MSYCFDAEDADLVLRSSDSKEFWVHRIILTIASPVFRDMFAFPQPHDSAHKLPHVDLPETADVLGILLLYIYPVPSPKIEDFVTLSNVLASAEKYAAEGVISRLRTILVSPHFLDLNPLRVYAIACRWSFLDEAKFASTYTVYIDLAKQGEECMGDMKYMSGLDYHRILTLQRTRIDMIQEVVTEQCYPTGCCSGYVDIKRLLVKEMSRKKLDVFNFSLVLETEKFKPCRSVACPLGRAKVEEFVKGVMTSLDDLPSSI